MIEARIKEIAKKFRVLDDWEIRQGSDIAFNGEPYTGQSNINLENKLALIYPWHNDTPEPHGYVLHEILHVAFRAASISRESEESFIEDLCTVAAEARKEGIDACIGLYGEFHGSRGWYEEFRQKAERLKEQG